MVKHWTLFLTPLIKEVMGRLRLACFLSYKGGQYPQAYPLPPRPRGRCLMFTIHQKRCP